jgi:hypothetical protein
MPASDDTTYGERCAFQQRLDEAFPRGAMCATLGRADGHLKGTVLLGSAGRIFCADARRSPESGRWEYRVLIDPRKSERLSAEPTFLWISGLNRNPAVNGLWEAEITEESGSERWLLRLNANPPAHLRPSKRARSAVTRVHEATLFPHGLMSSTRTA